MRHLLEFINENIISIRSVFESNNADRNLLRNYFSVWFKKHDEKMSNTDRDDYNEIFRKDLGKAEDEARKNLNIIIDYANKNNKPNLNLSISDEDEYRVVTRNYGASSKYNSFTIVFNGKKYYIANTTLPNSNLKNKELAPNKLLKLTDKNVYKTFDELNGAIKEPLEEISKRYPDAKIKDYIVELIKSINEKPKETISIDDFFDNNEKTITFAFDKKDIAISEGDVSCIKKDFGEILGPLMLLKLFGNNIEIEYPKNSNEPFVDYDAIYNEIRIPISAKVLGIGGKPSGSSVWNKVNKIVDKDNLLIKTANNEKVETVFNDIADLTTSEQKDIFDNDEIKFIKDVLETFSLSIFKQQQALINTFILQQNNINDDLFRDLKKLFDEKKISNQSDFANQLDEILKDKSDEDIKSWFTSLYELRNLRKNSSWSPDSILNEYKNLSIEQKTGIVSFPLWATTIKNINDTYGDINGKDVISSVIQKSVNNLKQIYFDISNKTNTITFKIVSGNNSKWRFTYGGLSTNNITNTKLSIELITVKD